MNDTTNSPVQSFFDTRAIKRISKDGVNQNFNIVDGDNNVLSNGVTISCWKNHLCFSGAYGTCVFKVSGTNNLLELFASKSLTTSYAKEKLVAASFGDDEDKLDFVVNIIKYMATEIDA